MRDRYPYQDQTTEGGGGGGAAPPAPSAAPPVADPPAAAPAAAPPAAFDWTQAGLDPAGMATITVKGWKGPADLLNSYVNLEKLAKAPEEQLIRLPKEITPETMAPVYEKLGRPKTPAEYNLPVPEGQPPEFAAKASEWMHKAGLSAKQALDLATANNEFATTEAARIKQEYTDKVAADTAALKGEWKEKYDANVQTARSAARTFGMNEAQISALETAMGFAGVHKFLHNIGSKLGEAEFVQSGGRAQDFVGVSPEMAQGRVAALKADANFVRRWNSKDPAIAGEAQAEMAAWVKKANPGEIEIR